MAYGGYSYFDKDYVPGRDDFVTVLWVKTKDKFERTAEGLAAESSVGTWTKLTTMNQRVWDNLRARVFRVKKASPHSGFVWIAYPYDHFDSKNLLQILASIRGNIFGLKEIEELRFLDMQLPRKFQRQYPGPKVGIKELRKIVGSRRRPHVGTIVKPKVGLTAKEWAAVAEKAFMGGLDMVKDDENLVDQKFCRWKDRAARVIDAAERAKDETGDGKIYVANITDELPRMLERVDWLVEHGWRQAMIDVYMIGIAGTREIINELHRKRFLIHAHRAGHGAETRGPWGVGYITWEKIWRLFGVSSLHTGTGVGKMEGSYLEIKKYGEAAHGDVEAMEPFFLEQKWDRSIKPIMPVASGGLHPGLVEGVVEIYGTDVTIMAGGGVHGHPGGTFYGAKAHRAAGDAMGEGVTLEKKAEKVPELREALNKWGYVKGADVRKQLERERKAFRRNAFRYGWDLDRVLQG